MKVIFRDDFYPAYTRHPAAESGRMEAVMGVIQSQVELVKAEPASEKDLLAVHTKSHVETVKGMRLYPVAALAAGGAIQAATLGLLSREERKELAPTTASQVAQVLLKPIE